jgi:hypothetical protein
VTPAASPPRSAAPTSSAAAPSAPAPVAPLTPGVHAVDVGGQQGVVVVPEHSNGGLVLYVHGFGGSGAAVVGPNGLGGLAPGLVAQGYTVVGGDAFGNAWGNPASVDSYAALVGTVRQMVPVQRVYLLAESMGGLAGAELVTQGRIPALRAYAAIYPLCDLSSVYDDFGDSVRAAWGADADQALATLSPVALSGAVPVLIWASPQDTVVDKARNADVCAAEARADGGTATVIRTRGDHGDPSNFDLATLLAFYAAA